MPSLTKKELDDLKAAGYVEGQPHTIPENISPVLKAKLLDGWEAPDAPFGGKGDHDGDGKPGGSKYRKVDTPDKRGKK